MRDTLGIVKSEKFHISTYIYVFINIYGTYIKPCWSGKHVKYHYLYLILSGTLVVNSLWKHWAEIFSIWHSTSVAVAEVAGSQQVHVALNVLLGCIKFRRYFQINIILSLMILFYFLTWYYQHKLIIMMNLIQE